MSTILAISLAEDICASTKKKQKRKQGDKQKEDFQMNIFFYIQGIFKPSSYDLFPIIQKWKQELRYYIKFHR